MKPSSLVIYFVTGGVFTTLIVALMALSFVLATVYIAVADRLKLFQ